jgi:hypothetical protein
MMTSVLLAARAQYMDLVERLGNKLGADSFQLNEQVRGPWSCFGGSHM